MHELKYMCNVFVKLLDLEKKKNSVFILTHKPGITFHFCYFGEVSYFSICNMCSMQNTCIILSLTEDMHRNPRAIHGHETNTFFFKSS